MSRMLAARLAVESKKWAGRTVGTTTPAIASPTAAPTATRPGRCSQSMSCRIAATTPTATTARSAARDRVSQSAGSIATAAAVGHRPNLPLTPMAAAIVRPMARNDPAALTSPMWALNRRVRNSTKRAWTSPVSMSSFAKNARLRTEMPAVTITSMRTSRGARSRCLSQRSAASTSSAAPSSSSMA